RLARAVAEQLANHRHDPVVEVVLPLLARLPDVHDAEDARILVEAGVVDDEPLRRLLVHELVVDRVVVRRRAVGALDRELGDEGVGHRSLLQWVKGSYALRGAVVNSPARGRASTS